MARSTTGISYASLAVVILGGLVFTVFVTIPAWSTWQATRHVFAERAAARDERMRFLQNIDARLQELQTYEEDARVLSVTFPDTEAPADATAIVGALASRNGLTARVVTGPELRDQPTSPRETALTAPVETVSLVTEGRLSGIAPAAPRSAVRGAVHEFRVKVRGTYAGVSAFLRDLEKSVRFFDIPSIDVKGGFDDGSAEADLAILTYIAGTGGPFLPASASAAVTGSPTTPSPVP
ncbi:MAG: hypothetical protein G01um101438_237 [Parcubacteria group bacterium Gr01-1014_38]|nr:MAG: hypothetical protein G01um101438_237 [Parcubacteria group bacterium Gr01-1014_38]